jgi:hypothetical protein
MRTAATKRSANAKAQRRWRQRQERCEASCAVDYGGKVLNMLVRRKYIEDHQTDDEIEIGKAISTFMRDHADLDEA